MIGRSTTKVASIGITSPVINASRYDFLCVVWHIANTDTIDPFQGRESRPPQPSAASLCMYSRLYPCCPYSRSTSPIDSYTREIPPKAEPRIPATGPMMIGDICLKIRIAINANAAARPKQILKFVCPLEIPFF